MQEKKKKRIKNKIVKTWLSEEEYQVLFEKSQYCGMTMSAYIRQQILNGAIIHCEPFEIKKVCYEINRIGNNIHQVTKKVNERNIIIASDVEDLRKQYEQLLNLVLDKIMGIE